MTSAVSYKYWLTGRAHCDLTYDEPKNSEEGWLFHFGADFHENIPAAWQTKLEQLRIMRGESATALFHWRCLRLTGQHGLAALF